MADLDYPTSFCPFLTIFIQNGTILGHVWKSKWPNFHQNRCKSRFFFSKTLVDPNDTFRSNIFRLNFLQVNHCAEHDSLWAGRPPQPSQIYPPKRVKMTYLCLKEFLKRSEVTGMLLTSNGASWCILERRKWFLAKIWHFRPFRGVNSGRLGGSTCPKPAMFCAVVYS